MSPRSPSGPLRHSISATASPTTTVGTAMPVLTTAVVSRRPGTRPRASAVPSGIPTTDAMAAAVRETMADLASTS